MSGTSGGALISDQISSKVYKIERKLKVFNDTTNDDDGWSGTRSSDRTKPNDDRKLNFFFLFHSSLLSPSLLQFFPIFSLQLKVLATTNDAGNGAV